MGPQTIPVAGAETTIARLWLEDGDTSRVSVCRGVRRTRATAYVPGAFVPDAEWTPLVEAEQGLLSDNAQESDVHVMSLPSADLETLRAKLTSPRLDDRIAGATELSRVIASRVFCAGPAVFDGVQTDRPGLETVTLSFDNRRLLGLHFDSWDHLSLQDRAKARRRLSLNLGAPIRHLVYLPTTLFGMVQRLRSSGEVPPSDADRLADAFMMHAPTDPVLRVTLRPGEFYVAPVEYLVHDASTSGNSSSGLSAVLRGHFRVAPF